MPVDIDKVNKRSYRAPRIIEAFNRRQGFLTNGEADAMRRVAEEAIGWPILDIGIGAGRTVPFLRSLSADYVGIDYVAEMVAAARLRYPEARIEQMDARDLSAFTDGSFGLVVFSFNGIDCVPHQQRRPMLSEIRRVLRQGGLFAYSTNNLHYRPPPPVRRSTMVRAAARNPGRAARYAMRLPKAKWRGWRVRGLAARGDGWASVAGPGYGSGFVLHHVSLGEALQELRDSGFGSTIELFTDTGFTAMIDGSSDPRAEALRAVDTRHWPAFHLLARKP